jgi:hypothetical protein
MTSMYIDVACGLPWANRVLALWPLSPVSVRNDGRNTLLTVTSCAFQMFSQIHPDLFQEFQFERARNAASLAKLNAYVECLSGDAGDVPAEVDLEFFVKVTPKGSPNGAQGSSENGNGSFTPPSTISRHAQEFSRVVVCLKPMSTAPLSPLFLAFGLISPTEADGVDAAFISRSAEDRGGRDHTDLLVFLRQVLSEASTMAQSYNQMKKENNDLREELERTYMIERIDLGGESYVTSNNQQVHRECLENFQEAMVGVRDRDKERLSGLSVRLYHPNYLPAVNSALQDSDGTFRMRNVLMESHVGENGMVHLVAGVEELRRAMERLDLERASIFTRVEAYWFGRSRALADELGEMLGVERVWYNSLGSGELKDFVVWAGEMYEYLRQNGLVMDRAFSFSIVVGSSGSEGSEPIAYIPSSRLLTVTTECSPRVLVEFLQSENALEASLQSQDKSSDEYYEEQALELAREALGAKKLVRICTSYETGAVMEACGRLIEVGERMAGLDLSNVELAIDDRYDIWDSGIISVPYDFVVDDVEARIRGFLEGGNGTGSSLNAFGTRRQLVAGRMQPRGWGMRRSCHVRPRVLR